MSWAADVNRAFAVVIPVFNHGTTLSAVVEQAVALGFPVYVVDDGSSDGGTVAISIMRGVRLLRHATNRGKGAALITGFKAASDDGARWAITLDADGQHHPEEAEALMRVIATGSRPIVVGRRQGMVDAGAPWTSRFGREFSNFWIRRAGGPPIRDTQSGFRIYPLPEVIYLGVRARRYQFEIEVLVKAAWRGWPMIEVPIRVDYRPRGGRISHFRPFVDFLRNSATFTRLITQSIFGLHR